MWCFPFHSPIWKDGVLFSEMHVRRSGCQMSISTQSNIVWFIQISEINWRSSFVCRLFKVTNEYHILFIEFYGELVFFHFLIDDRNIIIWKPFSSLLLRCFVDDTIVRRHLLYSFKKWACPWGDLVDGLMWESICLFCLCSLNSKDVLLASVLRTRRTLLFLPAMAVVLNSN